MQHTASLGHTQQSRKSSTIVAGVGAAMVATAVTFAMLSSSSSAPVATTPTTEAPAKECRNVPPADAVCRNHKRRRHGSLPRRQLPFASDHAFDRTAARDISARAFANHDDRGTRDDRRAGDRSRDYFAVERCAARVSNHQRILGAHGNVVAFQGLLESIRPRPLAASGDGNGHPQEGRGDGRLVLALALVLSLEESFHLLLQVAGPVVL